MVNKSQPSGVILPVAVIFLLFLTMVGITMMQSSALQQHMAGNTEQLHRAFHAADAGLHKGFNFALRNRTTLGSKNVLRDEMHIDNAHVVTTTYKLATSKTLPRGFSMRGKFRAQHYAIESHASVHTGAQSSLVRGFTVVGPGN